MFESIFDFDFWGDQRVSPFCFFKVFKGVSF